MEEIITVLQQWSDYKQSHPRSKFEDFCRFYLASPKIKNIKQSDLKSIPPLDTDSMFMMTTSRSVLAFWVYMRIALKDTAISSIEEIMVCSALKNLGESRKTDIINYAMMEISTGTDILNRLIEKGFIHQRVDPDDKRSKLLVLTTSGMAALRECYKKATLAREIFLADVTEEDKKLVAQILDPLQEKHSKLSVESKGKTIEEIHSTLLGKKKKIS
jgi:DNA-binding MarR family transcriptional regulator